MKRRNLDKLLREFENQGVEVGKGGELKRVKIVCSKCGTPSGRLLSIVAAHRGDPACGIAGLIALVWACGKCGMIHEMNGRPLLHKEKKRYRIYLERGDAVVRHKRNGKPILKMATSQSRHGPGRGYVLKIK